MALTVKELSVDLLRATLVELEIRGWTQGVHENSVGQVSVDGAILYAQRQTSFAVKTAEVLSILLSAIVSRYPEYLEIFDEIPNQRMCLAVWNDTQNRSTDEVKSLLENVISTLTQERIVKV